MNWTLLFVCLVVVFADATQANPCAVPDYAGRHAFSGGPQADIFIKKETITAYVRFVGQGDELEIKGATFVIDYVFDNRGAPRKLLMGFPIGAENPPAIRAFSVRGRGVGRRVRPRSVSLSRWNKRAHLGLCESGSPSPHKGGTLDPFGGSSGKKGHRPAAPGGHALTWSLWQQRFGVGVTKIRVRYKLHDVNPQKLSYVLKTARYWGDGRIGNLRIVIRSKHRSALKTISSSFGKPSERRAQSVTWRFESYLAKDDFELSME